MKNNFRWSFYTAGEKRPTTEAGCVIIWVESTENVAQRHDMKKREQGWITLGTRMDNSAIVRFHIPSASQEYTHTQKEKRILAWQRPGERRMERLHFTFALF